MRADGARTGTPLRGAFVTRAAAAYLAFFFPRSGMMVVIGAASPPGETGFGGPLSFFGFFASLLLRCMPLTMRSLQRFGGTEYRAAVIACPDGACCAVAAGKGTVRRA